MRIRNLLLLLVVFSLGVCAGHPATIDDLLTQYKAVPAVQKATRERVLILAGYEASVRAIRVQAELKAQELNAQLADILRQVDAQAKEKAKAKELAAIKKAEAKAKATADVGPQPLPAPPALEVK
jgi:hypothetical protein